MKQKNLKVNLIAPFNYGETSLEYFYKCGLENLGHTVMTRCGSPQALKFNPEADMSVVVGMSTLPPGFKDFPGKKVLIYPDNYGRSPHKDRTLDREALSDLFDRVYLCNRDPEVDDDLFHWLPFGYDCYAHPYLHGRRHRNVPCIFVGTKHPTRDWMETELPYLNFRIYGNGWPQRTNTRPAVYGPQKIDVYSRCCTALNSHYNKSGPNMRFFEILAMGRLMFCDKITGAHELGFIPGEHYVEYTDSRDLIIKMDYHVTHDHERRKIAAAGHKQVLNGHSYAHRMRQMIKEVMKC